MKLSPQRYCPHCDSEIGDKARFCGRCGKAVPMSSDTTDSVTSSAAPIPAGHAPTSRPPITTTPLLRPPSANQTADCCPYCGHVNSHSALACDGCGSRLPWANAPLPTTGLNGTSTTLCNVPVTPSAATAAAPVGTSAAASIGVPFQRRGQISSIYFRAPVVGAIGGLLAFIFGEFAHFTPSGNILTLIMSSAFWSSLCGIGIGAVMLAYDNLQSLRGRWSRDLIPGAMLFALLGFLGGAAGQSVYLFTQNSLTRGLGWSLLGASIGLGIGLLRRDQVQARRGMVGGLFGGFIGGFLFNSLSQISAGGNGAFSRAIGMMITGAMIALFMRVVQERLKEAWLVGLTPGPYKDKEYPLNTERITVGRSELNNISLYRESELAVQTGMFVREKGAWFWQGESVEINGTLQSRAALHSGTRIKLGATEFLFQDRTIERTT